MAELELANGDFTFAVDLNEPSLEPSKRPPTANVGRSLYGNTEEDSVGTLDTVGHTIVGNPASGKTRKSPAVNMSTDDSGTVTSGITVETRIDHMEGQMSSIHTTLAKLTNKSPTHTSDWPEQASASGDRAGGPSRTGRNR